MATLTASQGRVHARRLGGSAPNAPNGEKSRLNMTKTVYWRMDQNTLPVSPPALLWGETTHLSLSRVRKAPPWGRGRAAPARPPRHYKLLPPPPPPPPPERGGR